MSVRALPTLAATLLAALPVAAQQSDSVANGTAFGAWRVSCEAVGVGRTACALEQSLAREADSAFLAQVLLFWNGDGSAQFVAMRVPLGVYLPSGIEIRADDEDQALPLVWQSCNPDFCEAVRQLDEGRLAAFADDGGRAVAGYRPRAGREPVVFSFSMEGALDGMAALKPAAD